MNILMAWELGAGLGHTVPLYLLGEQLAAQGHHISYALRNPETASALGFDSRIEVFEAPAMGVLRPGQPAAYDYCDLLLLRAYEDRTRLDDRVDAWLRIFDRTRPDLLVADHAPCARLAAHIAGITSHAIGSGFAVPPLTHPLHPFVHPRGSDVALQERLELRLDRAINAVLKRRGVAEEERAITLFIGGIRFLSTLAELDNYSDREDERFYGPMVRASNGVTPDWPRGSGPRVFVYLYRDAPLLPVALRGLERLGIPTLVYLGNTRNNEGPPAAGPHTIISESPVDLSQLAGACDLVICQGGVSTLAASLLQGIPVLTYPRHVEQLMVANHVRELGLGSMLTGPVTEDAFVQTIQSILKDTAMRERTEAFASKYRDLNTGQVASRIATEIVDQAS